jgi:hypothetical protein
LRTVKDTLRVPPGCRVSVLTTTSNKVVFEGQSQKVAWPVSANLAALAMVVPFFGAAPAPFAAAAPVITNVARRVHAKNIDRRPACLPIP